MSFKLLKIGRDALRRVRIGRAALVAAAICAALAPTPSFAQTIDGDHTISADTKLTEDVTVNGQLILDGAAVDLNGHKLTVKGGWSVSGEAGADGADIVQNGSFETGFSTSSFAGWSDTSHPDNWTKVRGSVGNSRNNQPWIGVGVPNGTYVAYLQTGGTIEQTLTVPESGFYTMSFKYAARRDSGYAGGLVNVSFDGKVCFKDEFNRNATAARTGTATVWLDAGTSVLQIRHTFTTLDSNTDQAMWVDSVKVVKADVAPGIYGEALGEPGELRIETANAADVAATLPPVSGNAKVVYALTGNADWTTAGSINIPAGATLDLCGHTLAVAGLIGGGIVTDSANGYYTVQRDAAGEIYLQTEYLKATQNGASNSARAKIQCINTGYAHNKDTEVDLRISYQSASFNTYSVAFGGRNSTKSASQFGLWCREGQFAQHGCDSKDPGNSDAKVGTVSLNTIYNTHVAKTGANYAQIEGTETVVSIGSGNGDDGNFSGADFMFSNNQHDNSQIGYWPCQCTIYECTISENGAAMRHFIPAKRLSDGEYGMFDTVYQKFYARVNSTSDPFVSGDYIVNSEAAEFGSSGVLRIAVPANTTLELDDMPLIVGDVKILKEGAGVLKYDASTSSQKYFRGGYEDHSAPLTAVWTGAANNNDFDDPENWTCYNDLGNALSGVVPNAATTSYTLAADADWTSKGAISIEGATIDLAGHTLKAKGVSGAGLVSDTLNDAYAFYKELTYLQSTTVGKQFIDTGYTHDTRANVRIKFSHPVYPSDLEYFSFFGGGERGYAHSFGGWIHRSAGTYNIYRSLGATGADWYGSSAGTVYNLFIRKSTAWDNGNCYVANEANNKVLSSIQKATASNWPSGTTPVTAYLFGHHNLDGTLDGSYAASRIYVCQISDAGMQLRNFVPMKHKVSGKPGMMDKLNNKFYTNANPESTEDFIAGPETTAAAPTATAAEIAAAGTFVIDVDEGESVNLSSLKLYGKVKLVKTGAGTLVQDAAPECVCGIEVREGTFQTTAALSASITVDLSIKAGATVSIACAGATSATMPATVSLEAGAKLFFDLTDFSAAEFALVTEGVNLGTGASVAECLAASSDLYGVTLEGATTISVALLTAPVTAVWTGLGEAGNFDDPGNWSCSNKNGVALSDKIPDSSTLTFRLATDADWTARDAIALGAGVTLDLNGRDLTAASITGDGIVVNTVAGSDDPTSFTAPDGSTYQKIQYVQATQDGASNGAQTKIQYVDTGYYHIGTTKVDIRVEFQDVSYSGNYGYAVFYGCRDQNNYKTAQLGGWIHNSKFYYYDTGEHDGSTAKTGVIYDVRLDKNGSSYANYEDGTRASTLGTGNGAGSSNTYGTDYIFANNQVPNGGKYWPCKCKVYSCKVYTGDTLERDFVPVRCISGEKAGEAGFWCNVTKKFYGNSGYGSLTAGPVVGSGYEVASTIYITVSDGQSSFGDLAKIYGDVKVVKDGAGTLVAPVGGQYFSGGIEVRAGTLSMGGALAYGGAINAASGTTVSVPASVGSAGTSVINITGGTLDVANCGTSVVTGTVTLGGNAISVAGSFAPVSGTAAHAITLADGATLDFTKWTGEFPVASPTIAYASGANITLKLEPATTALTALARSKDAETGKPNGYLLSWDSPPTDVAFSPDAATRARFRVVPDENGLLVSLKAGSCIIIK